MLMPPPDADAIFAYAIYFHFMRMRSRYRYAFSNAADATRHCRVPIIFTFDAAIDYACLTSLFRRHFSFAELEMPPLGAAAFD